MFLSADGAGSNDAAGHSIDVQKPSDNATVLAAFLFTTEAFDPIADGETIFEGTPITSDVCHSVSTGFLFACRAEITALIKDEIDAAPAGILSFTITESTNPSSASPNGQALLVVFDDPAQTGDKSIILLDGAQAFAGDSFAITLGEPIDPNAPGAQVDMGLGIGHGFQGSSQVSVIDVNGGRLTSSAGGQDDGIGENGALITVGGLGDSTDNPPDPDSSPNGDPRYDDELYSLLPFISATDGNISVFTENPSNDDIIFLAYFELSTQAILGEGIILTPGTATNPVGTNHTVTAQVVDDNGDPLVGVVVTFDVLSGPNSGTNGSAQSDASGNASFTYSGLGGPGVDQIIASFETSLGQTETSNVVTKEWVDVGPAVCDIDESGQVDILDIRAIAALRNTAANGPNDPADADGSGIIDVNDVRQCVLGCDNARCAQ